MINADRKLYGTIHLESKAQIEHDSISDVQCPWCVLFIMMKYQRQQQQQQWVALMMKYTKEKLIASIAWFLIALASAYLT